MIKIDSIFDEIYKISLNWYELHGIDFIIKWLMSIRNKNLFYNIFDPAAIYNHGRKTFEL